MSKNKRKAEKQPTSFKEETGPKKLATEVVSLESIREDFREAGVSNYGFSMLSEKITATEIQLTDITISTAEKILSILAKALRNIESIESVIILSGIGDTEASMLAESLKAGSNLKKLNLSHMNKISKVGIKPILESLKQHTHFETLNLEGNPLKTEGATEIAKALKSGLSMRSINLTRTKIGDKGVIDLSKALESVIRMDKLDLTGNGITHIGTNALAKVLKVCGCKEVILTSNNIGDKGITFIAKILECGTPLHKIEAMLCGIGEKGAQAMLEGLKKNEFVTSVYIGSINDKISATTKKAIAKQIDLNKKFLCELAAPLSKLSSAGSLDPESFTSLDFYRGLDKDLLTAYLGVYVGGYKKASAILSNFDKYVPAKTPAITYTDSEHSSGSEDMPLAGSDLALVSTEVF